MWRLGALLLLAACVAMPAAAEGLRLPFLGAEPILRFDQVRVLDEGEAQRSSAEERGGADEEESPVAADEEDARGLAEASPDGALPAEAGREAGAADARAAEASAGASSGAASDGETAEPAAESGLISLGCTLHFREEEETTLLLEPRITTLCGLEVAVTSAHPSHEGVPIYEATFRVERQNGSWRLEGGALARARAGGVVAQTTYRQSGSWDEPIVLMLHLPAGERGYRLRCAPD